MRALIFGASGQDGKLMRAFLEAKNYEVVGASRRLSDLNASTSVEVVCDIRDAGKVDHLIKDFQPDEVYHFAALSNKTADSEHDLFETNVKGTARLSNAILKFSNHTKLFHASSSAIFADGGDVKLNSDSKRSPYDAYGRSKLRATELVDTLREDHRLFACNGMLFHHDSIFKKQVFLLHKIALAVACVRLGIDNYYHGSGGVEILKDGKLHLGDLNVVRDFGFAPEYMEPIWSLLQQDNPRNCVIGTGVGTSVLDLALTVFKTFDLDGMEFITSASGLQRPYEPVSIIADENEAEAQLGWRHRTDMDAWMKVIVDGAVERVAKVSQRK